MANGTAEVGVFGCSRFVHGVIVVNGGVFDGVGAYQVAGGDFEVASGGAAGA